MKEALQPSPIGMGAMLLFSEKMQKTIIACFMKMIRISHTGTSIYRSQKSEENK